MSRIYEEVKEIREVTTQTYIKTVCDWCGEEITPEPYGSGEPEPEIEFKLQKKVDYHGDGGWAEEWEIEHLCMKCLDRMVLLLEEHKVGLVRREIDW